MADGGRARRLLVPLVLLAPLCLVGPVLVAGELLLPFHPVLLEPLASEHPEAAARARERVSFPASDRVFPALTDQLAAREELRSGRLPTWAPAIALGVPLHAVTIAGLAYPPNWLAVLLAPADAAAPLAILALALGGLGVWLFLGRLGLSLGARAVGVLALQLGGYGVQNLLDPMKVDAALWLPWQLWAVEGLARGRRASGFGLALATTLSLLAGFPQAALLGGVAAGAYALARLAPLARARGDGRSPRALALALVLLALGGVGGAVQLLPTAEASAASLRAPKTAAELRAEALPPSVLLGAPFANLFAGPWEPPTGGRGTPAAWWLAPSGAWERTQHANALEWSAYAGALVVLLAAAAAVATPRRAAFPLAALALCALYATGLPPGAWLYAVPGLGIGAPGRVAAVAWTLWAWLAALGVETLAGADGRRRARARVAFAAAALALLAGAAWLHARADPATFPAYLEATLARRYAPLGYTAADVRAVVPPDEARAAAERLRGAARLAGGVALAALLLALAWRLAGARGAPEGAARGRVASAAAALAVLVAAAAATRAFAAAPGPPPAALLAAALAAAAALGLAARRAPGAAAGRVVWLPLALVLLVEGLAASRGWIVGQERDVPLFPPSPTIERVARAAGDGRVLRVAAEIPAVEALARPNLLQPYGVLDLTPWVALTPRGPVDLLRALEPRSAFRSGVAALPDATHLGARLLDLLGVGAILSREPLEHPRLEPELERPGFHVYRRTGALPPAFLVGEEIGAASDEAAAELTAHGAFDPARRAVLAPGEPPRVHPPGAGRAEAIEVARPARNRLDVRVRGGTGGLLVMREQHAPGWKATVDGRDAEVLRVDHALRGVRVPPGDVLVRTWYEPASLRLGVAATAAALAAAAALARRARP